MALAVKLEATICGFNVRLGLDMCMFVEQLGAQKRKHAFTLHLHGELNRGMVLVQLESRGICLLKFCLA